MELLCFLKFTWFYNNGVLNIVKISRNFIGACYQSDCWNLATIALPDRGLQHYTSHIMLQWWRLCKLQVSTRSSPLDALRKRCSENMQQVYRKTLMSRCDLNKAAKQLYWNRTLAWVFFCKFATYFQNNFS